jgi:hypothetical protein
MLRRMLVIAALTGVLGTAQAQSVLEVVEHAAEVPFSRIDWPASETGTVRFSLCTGCEVHTARLSAETRYRVNHREVPYIEFAAAVKRAQDSAEIGNRTLVGLFYDLASGQLTRISL